MKDTINKDKRRIYAYQKDYEYRDAWKISLKHSNIVMKHIDKEDLYEVCISSHYQFMEEVKANRYRTNHTSIQIWNTMLNTIMKCDDNMRSSVRLLHQTNLQRSG